MADKAAATASPTRTALPASRNAVHGDATTPSPTRTALDAVTAGGANHFDDPLANNIYRFLASIRPHS